MSQQKFSEHPLSKIVESLVPGFIQQFEQSLNGKLDLETFIFKQFSFINQKINTRFNLVSDPEDKHIGRDDLLAEIIKLLEEAKLKEAKKSSCSKGLGGLGIFAIFIIAAVLAYILFHDTIPTEAYRALRGIGYSAAAVLFVAILLREVVNRLGVCTDSDKVDFFKAIIQHLKDAQLTEKYLISESKQTFFGSSELLSNKEKEKAENKGLIGIQNLNPI